MKKILILFVALLLYPQQSFSKAICPIDISQEECCALKGELTLAVCQASCSGTCTEGYYASCYSCNEQPQLAVQCFATRRLCNLNNPYGENCVYDSGTGQYCFFLRPDDPEPGSGSSATVTACPAEGTLSADKCCCEY